MPPESEHVMSIPPRSVPLILIIDDDPDLVETLTDALELEGHFAVVRALDGEKGLDAVFAALPDCIVVDVRMPHLNGLQFVRAIRGDPSTEAIPIVMISALVQDHDLLAGMLSGADTYLRKPVRMAELLNAIQQSLVLTTQQRHRRWQDLADPAR